MQVINKLISNSTISAEECTKLAELAVDMVTEAATFSIGIAISEAIAEGLLKEPDAEKLVTRMNDLGLALMEGNVLEAPGEGETRWVIKEKPAVQNKPDDGYASNR